jgi:hypothetical protein
MMTIRQIEDMIIEKYPFMFRNNRGGIKTKQGYYTFGIPMPPHGRKEKDDEMKGSDYLGFVEIDGRPIFASIEIKRLGDRVMPGQIKWLKFVASHGGIAELWKETKNGLEIIVWKNE